MLEIDFDPTNGTNGTVVLSYKTVKSRYGSSITIVCYLMSY